jgi:hypothetical protein
MTPIIIRAVRERASYHGYLAERLPKARWCYDTARSGRQTMMKALHMAGEDAAVHMEDDALLSVGFLDAIETAITARPYRVIQFFSRRKNDPVLGSRECDHFSFNLCYYLPPQYSKLIREFMPGWADQHPEHKCANDVAVNDWLRLRREKHWLQVPSLVQHREGPSTLDPRRARRRQSATFVQPWL